MIENSGKAQKPEEKDPTPRAEDLLLELWELLPGDILLFRSIDQKKHQRKISKAIDSPYTHAAIYIGNGEIAESTLPRVRVQTLTYPKESNEVVGVLRSQMVFSARRAAALRDFADELLRQSAMYDLSGALTFDHRKREFIAELIDHLRENFRKVTSEEEFARQSYFCSALVVACYTISGVIEDSAEVTYPPDVFSPADLYRDPTFGWFLGYLARDADSIPADDPLMAMTLWRDHQDMRWWS